MNTFPSRSLGVLLSQMGDRAVAYDLVTETAHHLSVTAGALLVACDGQGDVDAAVAAWAEGAGMEPGVIAADVTAGLAMLGDLSLIGRVEPCDAPKKPVGSIEEPGEKALLGAVHPVIDYNIAFRGAQRELLDTLDSFLGTGTDGEEPTMYFDVRAEPDGEVVLVADYEWRFSSLESCLFHLTTVVNEYTVFTHSCVALHAGSVRAPRGEVVLLPAPSGDGRSTLTGAFVAAGWDYLGDEVIGVRPDTCVAVGYPNRLSVDSVGRAVLNLPASEMGHPQPGGTAGRRGPTCW